MRRHTSRGILVLALLAALLSQALGLPGGGHLPAARATGQNQPLTVTYGSTTVVTSTQVPIGSQLNINAPSGTTFAASANNLTITFIDGAGVSTTLANGVSTDSTGHLLPSTGVNVTLPATGASTAPSSPNPPHIVVSDGTNTALQSFTLEPVLTGVNPTHAPAGQSVAVSGNGFNPNAGLSFAIVNGTTNIPLTSGVSYSVSANGALSATLVIPGVTNPSNPVKITATDTNSLQSTPINFTIDTSTGTGGVTLSSASGSPGKVITVGAQAGTFSTGQGQPATITFTDSNGNSTTVANTTVNSDGSVNSVSFTIPAATLGTATFVIRVPTVSLSSSASFSVVPSISISQNAAPPGGTLTISGDGFSPNRTITITIGGVAVNTGTAVVTNSAGHFPNSLNALTITVPSTAPQGSTTIVASDGTASGSASLPFTVGNGSTSGTLTITPNIAPPGKGATVSAPNGTFPASGGTVALVFFDANNTSTTSLGSATIDVNGAFSTTITLPSSASAGASQITATNNSGGTVRVASGTITISQAISVSPTSGTPGSLVTVTGEGFGANKSIVLAIGGITVNQSSPALTNSVGHFVATVTVPSSVAVGSITVQATDTSLTQAATASFTVLTATGTPTITSTVTPIPTFTSTPTSTTPSPTVTSTPVTGGQVATTLYFAEGFTGQAITNGKATFSEVLNILNPGSVAAQVTITYYVQGAAAPQVITRTVAPNTVLRESVNADVGFDKIVGAMITSPQFVTATRTITRISAAGTRLDGSTTQPVAAPASTWAFPEGYTGITFQEYLTLLNPSATSPANVNILLAPQAASSAGARALSLVVPPLGRATANIRALNLGNNARSVGMLVTSTVPVVAERVEYFGDGVGSGKFGSTVSRGISAPATQLRIAYGNSGGSAPGVGGKLGPVGDQSYITMINPASTGGPVQATVSFADASGHPIGQTAVVSLAPGTRQTVVANLALGLAQAGPFSVSISATGPIAAEEAQYYGGSPNIGLHPGVAFPALGGAVTDAYLSDLSNQLSDSSPVKRTVYLYNPSSTAVQVAATYFGASGPTSQALYTVPAGGIFTVNVNQDTQASLPAGPIGAEYKVAAGSSGSFIAYGVGITVDGLSATEDLGITPSPTL